MIITVSSEVVMSLNVEKGAGNCLNTSFHFVVFVSAPQRKAAEGANGPMEAKPIRHIRNAESLSAPHALALL